MIISKDINILIATKRKARTLADNLNNHLEAYSKTGLPPVRSSKDFTAFAQDPVKYFFDQVQNQARLKKMDGVDLKEFARLYGYNFDPDLRHYPVDIYQDVVQYVKLGKEGIQLIEDIDQQLESLGITETETLEEEEAARILFRLFKDFTYVLTALADSKNGEIATHGTGLFGFDPLYLGQLNIKVVEKLSAGMQNVTPEKFNNMLKEKTDNPSLKELLSESI